MANDKYSGYSPDSKKEKRVEANVNINNRLDRVNPYEFRKGMDYELTTMGCSRLAESTIEERQKATEIVIKNLEEHGGYYSGLIQYTIGMNHAGPINETTFKEWLNNHYDTNKMKEIKDSFKFDKMEDVDHKNDKMEEPKYKKEDYTIALKEAIKNEVKNLLKEEEDKEPSKKQVKGLDKKITVLDKERESLEKKKKELHGSIKPLIQKFNNREIDKDAYMKKVKDTPKDIKDIITRLGDIEKEKEAILDKQKNERREVAETVMTREVHRKLLEIIKEKGISLREGSDAIRVYYEIAKLSYMEGLTAGLKD
tara:strand:+ start:2141 stop:3073 length:933 start_codon:yes stop_codon:yes gene_type:complete